MTEFKDYYRATQSRLIQQGVFRDDALPAFRIFDGFYGEDHRYYHNREHILELLKLQDTLSPMLVYEKSGMTPFEAVKVEVAIWYHDIIYQPKQTDNELRSAILFEALSPQLANYQDIVSIYSTIVHTTHFREDSKDLSKWSQYMLDLDLAGFGSSSDKFRENTLKLRMENAHVNDETFDTNRIAFLRKLLERGRPIYYNPYKIEYFEALEKKAQDNIANEMKLLMAREYRC